MRSIGKRLSLLAVGGVAALALAAPNANAAFDSNHDAVCETVDSITGVGASFQRDAHRGWGAGIFGSGTPFDPRNAGWAYSFGSCSEFKLPADGGTETFSYNPAGSGAGRDAMGGNGLCDPRTRTESGSQVQYDWAGTDDPLTPQQITWANQGSGCSRPSATLHTIPIAQGAISVAARLPDGCQVSSTGGRQLSRLDVEGHFSGDADYNTWGELVGSALTASSGSGLTDAQCRAKSPAAVVRLDSSGTTSQFKEYLQRVVETQGGASSGTDWASLRTSANNTQWPRPVVRSSLPAPEGNGNGPLLDALSEQGANGGIGYSDLATARSKGYGWDYTGSTANADDRTIWMFTQRISDNSYLSPAQSQRQDATNTQKGANCVDVPYEGTPASTTSSWESATSVNNTTAYPLCILTYAMVFQNPSGGKVPGATQSEHRAVKDYLLYILRTTSGGGQLVLEAFDYTSLPDTLPSSILTKAQNGQKALTWG
jgi:ABC-type phosphate transport system substrate-binding protein